MPCDPCRQRKTKCNGGRPACSQCRAKKIECVYRQTPEDDYRAKFEALRESHPAAVVYRALQQRSRPEALDIVYRIQAGVDAETLARQLTTADLLLQVQLEPETRSRYSFIYSPMMPAYLQTLTNPFIRSLIHEWSDRDDASSIASPALPERDLGYRAQYLRPHHAATIVDSRLDEIVPSKWTTVDAGDNTMRELIRAYFLQEYDWFTFFHKDYFLDDMISGYNTFCSPLLVNAVLAVGCQCRNYFSEPAEFWNPASLGYKFLAEAKRLWIVDITQHRNLTTLQAALVLNTIVNMFDMDPLSSAYLVQATRIAHELDLFEPTTYIMNKKIRQSYDLTAWSLFHWQCLHYCYVQVQLYEILAPGGRKRSPSVPFDEDELYKSLTKYRGYFETLLRIHYLRHSFEYGNMMLTRFLAMLAFLALNKLEALVTESGSEKRSSSLDVGDTDPKEARATLLIAQKGLSDQGRGYYLPKTLLQDVLHHMTPSDANLLQSYITIPPEGPEKVHERKMYMEDNCPPDILHIAHDSAQQPDENWIRRFAMLTLGEKTGRSVLGMISGGDDS
ncbi:hypothetical protein ACHAPJ_007322 [Fusarium lateritium]